MWQFVYKGPSQRWDFKNAFGPYLMKYRITQKSTRQEHFKNEIELQYIIKWITLYFISFKKIMLCHVGSSEYSWILITCNTICFMSRHYFSGIYIKNSHSRNIRIKEWNYPIFLNWFSNYPDLIVSQNRIEIDLSQIFKIYLKDRFLMDKGVIHKPSRHRRGRGVGQMTKLLHKAYLVKWSTKGHTGRKWVCRFHGNFFR